MGELDVRVHQGVPAADLGGSGCGMAWSSSVHVHFSFEPGL